MALIFDHIIEANKILFEYGYKLSLKDACGASCLQLKNLDGTRITTSVDPLIYTLIDDHFKKYNLIIEYSQSKEYLFAKNM
ncbi:RDAC family protein [Streptobacillus canis]|uniref:RDAC family protein n=1 Tax=Streptobacillus canis TaxID=2678686 RepID=UPI0012E1D64D|nr:hypothetical protein [Streptobacillus canis]